MGSLTKEHERARIMLMLKFGSMEAALGAVVFSHDNEFTGIEKQVLTHYFNNERDHDAYDG